MSQPPKSPRSGRRPPPSSAKFLKHLHTDPSSHHITLSGHDGSGSGPSPRSIDRPLEPTVREQPMTTHQRAYTSPVSPVAGPSAFQIPGRTPSRRGRPKTAPSRPDDAGSSRGIESSPDLPPPIPPQGGEMGHLSPGGDSCISALAVDEGLMDAMDFLSVSSDGRSHLIGRSGTLLGTSATQAGPANATGATRQQGSAAPPSMSWATFSQAYAHGLFDPNKIPNPPTLVDTPNDILSAHSSPGKKYSLPATLPRHNESGSEEYSSKWSGESGSTMTNTSSAPSTSAGSTSTGRPLSMAASMAARKQAFEFEHLPNRPGGPSLRPDKLSLPSYSLAAATVRMASTSYLNDLSPLSIPSPEPELTDPLAAVVSAMESASTAKDSASSDPGSSRFPLHHSMSSASGTNPYANGLRLPTIQASPVSTPLEGPHKSSWSREKSPPKARFGLANSRIPPASAPLEKRRLLDDGTDYFGAIVSPPESGTPTTIGAESTPTEAGTAAPSSLPKAGVSPLKTRVEASPSTPMAPLPPLVYPADMSSIYEQYGWLPAPVPPDEISRRRALYRFNLLQTAADVNFDRIAHMAKLVFSPKLVFITLIDSDSQWYKYQTGPGPDTGNRVTSFCSHAILPKSDEPFVVLDTMLDWRFAQSPNVLGPPNIRFYAGAPLRTADGHNVGSLCIIDDKPRTEFTPRSRLILKEFAAVTMREMELWRDKLQLRVRDKIQTSMEKFTRECLEMDSASSSSNAEAAAKMDHVYARAAQLVCSTIGLDGCFILDIGQIEMVQTDTPTGRKTVYRADPYNSLEQSSPVLERSDSFRPVNAFPVLAAVPEGNSTRSLTSYEHETLSQFLQDHRDGRIFENVAPLWIRYMFPSSFRYGMAVPIFGVDQQPFAMICAYTAKPEKQFLEGYELQFLRAIGVIILSAVLRRRMVLADKTKSILISSVSHELRTPLHGILAAAELLADTELDSSQVSFLKTVQTCGTSLIETVNHVLDFTKLSGSQSTKSSSTKLGRVNLAALVEQTVEGCWIGQRARFLMGDADIGSFYAPPVSSGIVSKSQRAAVGEQLSHVETVIDVDLREKGWTVRCEKGGLRRVLMNLVGNSFKFTKDGYVQVSLREMPHEPKAKTIPVEMTVVDTGKGIGKDFLKDQLFHPFSQENPLQTGTGLGLAIVNSIVRSESVKGKVDVWSAENVGTEIKITFDVEPMDDEDTETTSSSSSVISTVSTFGNGLSVAFTGFHSEHKGHMLACEVLMRYANYWQFHVGTEDTSDIMIVNEDEKLVEKYRAPHKPLILLSVSRNVNKMCDLINRTGGFCRVVFKPVGPTALQKAMSDAVEWIEEKEVTGEHGPMGKDTKVGLGIKDDRPSISRGSSGASQESNSTISELSSGRFAPPQKTNNSRLPLQRRRSEENEQAPSRPRLAPRGMTYHHVTRRANSSGDDTTNSSPSQSQGSPTSHLSTISLADGGLMLKAAAVPAETPRKERSGRVMVVEDNVINRRVLGAFLKKKGFEYAEAIDGQEGVELFENSPSNFWDVILMDISMPNMNGHQATRAIRRIEASRKNNITEVPIVPPPGKPVTIPPHKVVQARAKIFALTGLATADDKREAFGSGVDGYLVKPVSLASLDSILKKIGF